MEGREMSIGKKNSYILSEVDRIAGGGGVFPFLLVLCVNPVSDLVVL
jgi:hypothetical protein